MENSIKPAGTLKKLQPKEAYEVYNRISQYECAEWSAHQDDCKENREYYYSIQYTEEEKTKLETRGQLTLILNKIRKAINAIVGLLCASQPKIQVVPAGGSDNVKSGLANKLIDWIWGNSGGVQLYRKAVKMALRDNISYLMIIRATNGKIVIIPLGYDEVLVDPKSKDPLFRDADVIYVVKWQPVEKVKAVYGVTNLVTEFPVNTMTNVSDRLVDVTVNRVFSQDKQYVKVYEGYRKIYYRKANNDLGVKVQKETYLGFGDVYIEELPAVITERAIVPLYGDDTENPYKRGEVHFLKGWQDFINKSHGVTLLNAQLMSNPKVFIRETDIADGNIAQFQDNYAKPGSVNVLSAGAEAPIVVNGQPLNSSFFTLYQDANAQFEEATVPKEIAGYSDASKTYNQNRLLDIREAVLDSQKHITGNIEAAISMLGMCAIEYCKAYLTEDQVIRITDSEKRVESMRLNQRVGLDLNDEESVRQYIQYQMRQGLSESDVLLELNKAKSDEKYAEGLFWIRNDVKGIDVDIQVIPGSYAPNYEMAKLTLLMDLFAQGIIQDSTPIIQHLPIEGTDDIIARNDVIDRQANVISGYEAELERLLKENESLQKKLVDAGVREVVVHEQVRQEKVTNQILNQARVEKVKQKAHTQLILQKVEHEAENLINGLQSQQQPERVMSREDEMVARIMAEITQGE